MTQEFLYDNLKKQENLTIFQLELSFKNLMHFQGEMVNFFSQKQDDEKRKC